MAPTKESARNFTKGLGTVVVAAMIGYLAFTANEGRLPGAPVTTVKAEFDDVGQLQPGSEVRQNGIVVGQVSAVQLVNGKPLVTMDTHDGVPMYRDGYAGIWDQSALAQKYVELRPGNPASGLLGTATLPVRQTESTHDVVALLDVFDPATRAAFGNSMRQLGGLAGYGPGLHDFVAAAPGALTDLGTISTTLVSQRTDLPSLLRTSDRLSERFNGRQQQITELLHQTDETLQALGVDGGKPLSDTVAQLPTTLKAARTALDDADAPLADLASATGSLRSGAGALGQATPDLRGTFRDARAPLRQVPDVVDDAKPAVDDLSDTLSDARGFTPKLADGLSSAAPPLKVLAPYSRDIGTLMTNVGRLFTNHDGWEHRLRLMVDAPEANTVLPNQVKDANNPYPKPGEAFRDRDKNGGLIPGDPGRGGK
ncbi:MlaD family protein [Pseudonocardia spinosispora]|uniref:MlaD family protein n=1 Tax=Pseudonocardia spinosispora TaxID=103441 RepID=UPI00040E922A|nr:MlaD family protein [Pseudonocardia spinosispora]